jgi:hypothetical protein
VTTTIKHERHALPSSLFYTQRNTNIKPNARTTPWGVGDGPCLMIPYWVKAALARNKLDNMDILDYEKIRRYLSQTDLAEIVCLNDNYQQFGKHPIFSKIWRSVMGDWAGYGLLGSNSGQRDNKEALRELNTTVAPLGESESIYNEVNSRLRIDKFDYDAFCEGLLSIDDDESKFLALSYDYDQLTQVQSKRNTTYLKSYHSIEILNNERIIIVLERGILDALEDRTYAKQFVSDYLKARYTLSPITDVSGTETFEMYFELL